MKKVLLIVRDREKATQLNRMLDHVDAEPILFGGGQGRRWDQIILCDELKTGVEREWKETVLKTRVAPGGELVELW